MNILELQLSIVMSRVPESGTARTLLEWTAPGSEGPAFASPDRAAAPDAAVDDERRPI